MPDPEVRTSHVFHAEAHLLSGNLQRPINQQIEAEAKVALNDSVGSHFTRQVENFSIEGLISFARGETRVSGARSLKNDGWITLSTSMLERFNAFEVVTADRLVSQVSTDHAYQDGHFPHVTFLGSQFENLRIGGFAPTLTLNLGICGGTPAGGLSYFQGPDFLNNLKKQTEEFLDGKALPKELKDEYDERLRYIKQLIGSSKTGEQGIHQPITCSLVQEIGDIPIPGLQKAGNVLLIPDFGRVTLGEIVISEKKYPGSERPCVEFELSSVKMKLGCFAHGGITAGTVRGNGETQP